MIILTINETINNSKNLIRNIGDKAINNSNNATDTISNLVNSKMESLWKNWLINHPFLGFCVSHPIISVVLLITLILTIWGVIQMIPSLLVKLWLLIFKSPFILGKSLLKTNVKDEKEELMQQILNKLEIIEAKQNELEKQLSQKV